MTTYPRTLLKDVNPGLANEELAAIQPGLHGTLKGFDQVGPRQAQPAPSTKKIGQTVSNGVLTEFFAEPGELVVMSLTSLSPAEETQMDATLAAHDWTQRSQAQILDDQDEADYDTLLQAYGVWGSLTDAQFKGAMKIFLRVVHRRFRGSTI